MKEILFVAAVTLIAFQLAFGPGQSAVPTLIFPPGARATGLGEAFVGLSDDANATFFNPAGLGLAPLANSWQSFFKEDTLHWVALTAKRNMVFAAKPTVWAATPNSLWRFDGKVWKDYESYLMEQNDNVEKVVGKFIDDDDKDRLEAVIDSVKHFNRIDEEKDEEYLVEIKIPFKLGINGRITALVMDKSDRLFVGTLSGLRRYDGASWKTFTSFDGMVGNHVTSLCVTPDAVWVGTDRGLSCYKDSEWKNYTVEKSHLPSNMITAVAVSGATVWVGTDSGLVKIEDGQLKVFSKSDGLLENKIKSLAVDNENVLWVAHPKGVTSFTGKKWKKFNFKDNKVFCVGTDKEDLVWVGTQKGVLRYFKGKPYINKKGKRAFKDPEWKHFHSKNALVGNRVVSVAFQGRDVWVVTDKAINKYDRADRQALFSHEQLLPRFNFPDLYHSFFAITWPAEEWGTFGLFVNFISFGEIRWRDPLGRKVGDFYSWEIVGSLCYGMQLMDKLGLGINAKIVYSPLAPGVYTGNQKEEGIGETFAVDLAVLKRDLLPGLDFGFHLQNMGPPIVYVDKNQSDPIPFNVKTGAAYHLLGTPLHQVTLLFDANRELVKPHLGTRPDPWYKAIYTSLNDEPWRRELEQVILNSGVEYCYSNFITGRIGNLYDPDGSRRELTFGLGVEYGNLQIDWSYITQPWDEASPARVGQQRYSVLFKF